MKVNNITQQKYWLRIFLVGLSIIILFISSWRIPKEMSAQEDNSPGQIYHGVFPGSAAGDLSEEDSLTLDDLRSYEEHVGRVR
jgi:hypothetical protein